MAAATAEAMAAEAMAEAEATATALQEALREAQLAHSELRLSASLLNLASVMSGRDGDDTDYAWHLRSRGSEIGRMAWEIGEETATKLSHERRLRAIRTRGIGVRSDGRSIASSTSAISGTSIERSTTSSIAAMHIYQPPIKLRRHSSHPSTTFGGCRSNEARDEPCCQDGPAKGEPGCHPSGPAHIRQVRSGDRLSSIPSTVRRSNSSSTIGASRRPSSAAALGASTPTRSPPSRTLPPPRPMSAATNPPPRPMSSSYQRGRQRLALSAPSSTGAPCTFTVHYPGLARAHLQDAGHGAGSRPGSGGGLDGESRSSAHRHRSWFYPYQYSGTVEQLLKARAAFGCPAL